MKCLRVLIVDDEPLARRRIRNLIEQETDFEVIGECALGREAVAALTNGQQDVVFLDVRMPDMNGFEVLMTTGLEALPMIVFVTAHGDHAVEAFDVRAVDYLLKPFDDERFAITLDRIRQMCSRVPASANQRNRIRQLVESEHNRSPESATLVVRSGGRTTLLAPEEIKWIEAEGSYVRLHTAEQGYLLRESMGRLEKLLAEHGFHRIHRSTLLRLEEVRELRKHLVILRDGTQLTVSERLWTGLRNALGV